MNVTCSKLDRERLVGPLEAVVLKTTCASILKGTVKCGIRTTGDLLATHFLFGKCFPELVWGHSCGMTLGKA